MTSQSELFGNERYAPFEDALPDDYPRGAFKPLHPAFTKRGEVISGTAVRRKYYVDLAIGECACDKGWAWRRNELGGKKEWYAPAYCTHKLRMICRIIDDAKENGATDIELGMLKRKYLDALGTRYNPFEVVSAFHKELRRGDVNAAWFWGLILLTKRSLRKVLQYLLNIIYEETRDHELAEWLIKAQDSERMLTLSSLFKAISWFCKTPKKWELPRRYAIFEAEMRGYRQLVKDYGEDVARGSNIIPVVNKARLLVHLRQGAKEGDMVRFQRGLKGLQKLQYMDEAGYSEAKKDRDGQRLGEYRFWLYGVLYDLADELCPDTHDVWQVVAVVNKRIEAGLPVGYHELNAIGDAIMGEPADAGILDPKRKQMAVARPSPGIIVGEWPAIPLYAHDNHTYGGKRLMGRFPNQLKPGAEQTDLDFRYCGAYFGVAYRMISQKEHGRVADWHEVKWPTELHNIVMSLWY